MFSTALAAVKLPLFSLPSLQFDQEVELAKAWKQQEATKNARVQLIAQFLAITALSEINLISRFSLLKPETK